MDVTAVLAVLLLLLAMSVAQLPDVLFEEMYGLVTAAVSYSQVAPTLRAIIKRNAVLPAFPHISLPEPSSGDLMATIRKTIHEEADDLLEEFLEMIATPGPKEGYARMPQPAKRSLDFLGRLLHMATGVVGPDQQKEINDALQQLQETTGLNQGAINQLLRASRVTLTAVEEDNDKIKELGLIADDHAGLIDGIADQAEKTNQGLLLYTTEMSTIQTIREAMTRSRFIMSDGRRGFLSPYAMSVDTLKEHINELDLADRTHVPIFPGQEASKYYSLRLGTSFWINDTLVSTLRVPMVTMTEKFELRHLTKVDKANATMDISGFSFVAMSKSRRAYMLLTDEDIRHCTKMGKVLVCRRRSISILERDDIPMGSVLVHEILPNTFLVLQPDSLNGSLACGGKESLKKIPKAAIVMVVPYCSLSTPAYTIHASKWAEAEADVTIFEVSHDLDQYNLGHLKEKARTFGTRMQEEVRNSTRRLQRIEEEAVVHQVTQAHVIIGVGTGGGVLTIAALVLGVAAVAYFRRRANNLNKNLNRLSGAIEMKATR